MLSRVELIARMCVDVSSMLRDAAPRADGGVRAAFNPANLPRWWQDLGQNRATAMKIGLSGRHRSAHPIDSRLQTICACVLPPALNRYCSVCALGICPSSCCT